MEPVFYVDMGRIEYRKAYLFQKRLCTLVAQNKLDQCLLVCEHDPVYTIGKSGREFPPRGIPSVYVDRGGDITFHGPGQLVGYPIMRLQHRRVSSYIYTLEKSIISLLSDYEISGEIKKGFPGVWVEDKKIASIGVRIKDDVSYHGFALNVNTNLHYFEQIKPCGMDVVMTSLKEVLTGELNMEEVKTHYRKIFEKSFKVYAQERKYDEILSHHGY
ncbi:MAG: lipoyl(octanoyl) transferase LipB [Theionarchaea archaeon]|nr:lipoyl(octanoyl) transferase LipB [Theionarchaea archaeon]